MTSKLFNISTSHFYIHILSISIYIWDGKGITCLLYPQQGFFLFAAANLKSIFFYTVYKMCQSVYKEYPFG
ncbi:hypothetical protein Bcop_1707 [Bacteroides coprosuis DSM 18011]|uniref:Uncharacterized protein n=1 Tax=Bacteroides coprosuis DSM 18011 TaxID=679937 RepID=F3ZR26_9BACE|nr:hypothetical protein Bcop_1707 [Bacteroides coprosuis DSM 18011]